MSALKKFIAGLAAFVGASAQANHEQSVGLAPVEPDHGKADTSVTKSVVFRPNRKAGFGWTLASHSSHSSHRSHSSHSSHSSHYSSAGGSSYRAPVYTPPAETSPPPSKSPTEVAADEAVKLVMRV